MLVTFTGSLVNSTLWLLFVALQVLWAFVQVLFFSVLRACERNLTLKVVPPAELDLPLLSARLADLPYQVDNAEEIARAVGTLLQESRLLHYEEQALMETNAVWFLCEGRRSASAAKAMFLVFRGTGSPTDVITDVMFRPGAGPNGVRCHGGFLRTVREDATLHATLMQHLPGCDELYIIGHSLGGALSQVVAGAGFLPKGFGGRLTIVSLGGPVAFFGTPDAAAFDAPTAGAHVVSVVNANDIVPRLLGCPLSFSRKLLSFFAATPVTRCSVSTRRFSTCSISTRVSRVTSSSSCMVAKRMMCHPSNGTSYSTSPRRCIRAASPTT